MKQVIIINIIITFKNLLLYPYFKGLFIKNIHKSLYTQFVTRPVF